MINFGKTLFFLSFYFSVLSSIHSQNLTFAINSEVIAINEATILEVRAEGEKNLATIDTNYESKNVKISFIGSSSETQIVNFKVTRSQMLRYRVSSSTIGKHPLPTISVSLDGKIFSSPVIFLQVTAKRNQPKLKDPSNLFDQFFGESEQESNENGQPEVIFHTNKTSCYIGEPIVGYFVLYYNGLRQPYLERDPNRSISFPFFLSETLKEVTIQIDPTISRNGIEKKTLVYSKEIYGLTPLRVGAFQLGATNFVVGDSLRFGAIQDSIPASVQKIEVMALPKGAPENFEGAIGEYELSFLSNINTIHLGESFYFSIIVNGSGGGNSIENPLKYAGKKNKNLSLIKKSKSKVFKLLTDGEYGFFSSVDFKYSLEPDREGKIYLPPAKILYFSVKKREYVEKTKTIPVFTVLPKLHRLPAENKDNIAFSNLSNRSLYFGISLLILVISGLGYIYYFQQKKIETSKILDKLGQKLGTKRGEILKDYLTRNGIKMEIANLLTDLSLTFKNEDWKKIYTYCGSKDKQILLNVSNHLNN